MLPWVIGTPVKENMATEPTTALIDLRPPPLRPGSTREPLVAEAAATGPHDDRAERGRPGKVASRALLIGTGGRECGARQVLGVAPGAGERDSLDRGRKQDATPPDKGRTPLLPKAPSHHSARLGYMDRKLGLTRPGCCSRLCLNPSCSMPAADSESEDSCPSGRQQNLRSRHEQRREA